MQVRIPRVFEDDNRRAEWRPLSKDGEMMAKCKEQEHENLVNLINKPPRWNEQVNAYVLNFNGRVTMVRLCILSPALVADVSICRPP